MEKAWLKHYDKGIPPTLQPYPERTLLDEVQDAARQRPDHPALLFEGLLLPKMRIEKRLKNQEGYAWFSAD